MFELHGVRDYRLEEKIDYLASGKIDIGAIITDELPFERTVWFFGDVAGLRHFGALEAECIST